MKKRLIKKMLSLALIVIFSIIGYNKISNSLEGLKNEFINNGITESN